MLLSRPKCFHILVGIVGGSLIVLIMLWHHRADSKPFIAQAQAIAIAQRAEPQTYAAAHITVLRSTDVALDVLTALHISTPSTKWFVRFDGVENVSSGPPGAVRNISSTLYVVVDAQTGQFIESLTYGS